MPSLKLITLEIFLDIKGSGRGKKFSHLKSLEKKAEASNLLNIYSDLSKIKLEKVLNEMAGKDYSFLKIKLAEILIGEITPVGKEIQKLLDDKLHLKGILKKGSEKANIIAEENLKNIRDIVGLI